MQGTEFLPGSHLENYKNPVHLTEEQMQSTISPKMTSGSLLLYDYRIVHRGKAHRGKKIRPMVYMTRSKIGREETINFPKHRKLIPSTNEEQKIEL